jgi:hypothetical protein
VQFEIADFVFRKDEMSAPNIDTLMSIWGLDMAQFDHDSPFHSHQDMYNMIDSTKLGDAPWKCLKVRPSEPADTPGAQQWKMSEYELWYRDPEIVLRNMLDNPDFDGEFDYSPYVEVDVDDKRRWSDYMSGNFAWRQCIRDILVTILISYSAI